MSNVMCWFDVGHRRVAGGTFGEKDMGEELLGLA